MTNDLIYIYNGIMICVSISFVVALTINILLLGDSIFYYFLIFPIGLFMGIGLLPFKIRKQNQGGKTK